MSKISETVERLEFQSTLVDDLVVYPEDLRIILAAHHRMKVALADIENETFSIAEISCEFLEQYKSDLSHPVTDAGSRQRRIEAIDRTLRKLIDRMLRKPIGEDE